MGTAHKVANLIFEAANKISRRSTSSASSTHSDKVSDKVKKETQSKETDTTPAATATAAPSESALVFATSVPIKKKLGPKSRMNDKENHPPRPGPKSVREKERMGIFPETETMVTDPETRPKPRPKSVQDRLSSSEKVSAPHSSETVAPRQEFVPPTTGWAPAPTTPSKNAPRVEETKFLPPLSPKSQKLKLQVSRL